MQVRHLLERHKLGKQLFVAVNQHLKDHGIKVTRGTIVDASIINAPTSTKNRDGRRDPEMHQTAKGKQWYFGMKAHIGVDSKTELIRRAAPKARDFTNRRYRYAGKINEIEKAKTAPSRMSVRRLSTFSE